MKTVFSTIRPISDKQILKVKPKRSEAKDRLVKVTGTIENEEAIDKVSLKTFLESGQGMARTE